MTATEQPENVLRVEELSVSFTGEAGSVAAVDGVSFVVRRGEILAIVGESGCGKSVTAMALTSLLPDTAKVTGSVSLADGTELIGASGQKLSTIRGRSIAYVFQEPMTSLNPVLTVGKQIIETLRKHERLSRHAARARAIELLELVGMPAPERQLKSYPHQLSGGMRQRVMIAIAVACNPSVLVADEATTALDVTVQAGILAMLRQLREKLGMALIVITHDLGVVADLADRVMVMYAGRVVEHADVYELFDTPRHPYTAGLLSAVPHGSAREDGTRLKEIPGVVPVLREQPNACTFADRCERAISRCYVEQPLLQHAVEAAQFSSQQAACWNMIPAKTEATQ